MQTTEQPDAADSAFVLTPTAPHELATVCCIGISGVFGNALVLVVLLGKTYRTKLANSLIISQSVVDLLLSIFLITTFVSTSFMKTYSAAGSIWCHIIDSELLVSLLTPVSTTNLLVLTAERYLMVVFPVIHRNYINRRSINVIIGFFWMLSMATSMNCIQIPRVVAGICIPAWAGLPLVKRLLTMVLLFWAPLVIFMGLYSHMLYTIRKRSKVNQRKTTDSNPAKKKVESNLINVSISVTLAYLVCWGPAMIYYIIVGIDGRLFDLNARRYLSFLAYANCCVNPIMYAFSYNDFKNGVRGLFRMKQKS